MKKCDHVFHYHDQTKHDYNRFAAYLGKLYNSLVCWKDKSSRAIDGYKGVLGVRGCYEAAKSLGLSRPGLYQKIDRYEIKM